MYQKVSFCFEKNTLVSKLHDKFLRTALNCMRFRSLSGKKNSDLLFESISNIKGRQFKGRKLTMNSFLLRLYPYHTAKTVLKYEIRGQIVGYNGLTYSKNVLPIISPKVDTCFCRVCLNVCLDKRMVNE